MSSERIKLLERDFFNDFDDLNSRLLQWIFAELIDYRLNAFNDF